MTTSQTVNDEALIAIGFRLSSAASPGEVRGSYDIESTIVEIVQAFTEDYRIAAMLMSWIKVHGNYVIVEKLLKLRDKCRTEYGEALPWMSLIAAWAVECGYNKWRKMIKKQVEPTYLYDPEVSEIAIQRKGMIAWLKPYGFRIPQNSLRIRESDVLTPRELIKTNLQYRNRYLFGPSWRADIITAVQRGITSPMEISRALGCSYEPAYRISHEYLMVSNVEDGRISGK